MIKVDMNEQSETTRVLTIEVPQDEVNSAFSLVTAKVRQKAKLPGFRKGKIPLDIIEKNYAYEINEEVLDKLFSLSYPDALNQTKVVPIVRPKVDKVELDKHKPLIYQVTVEVLPKVKLGNYKGLKLKADKVEIKDKEVDEVLENLRQHHATLEQAPDRASQKGDVLTIDFSGQKDGQPVPGTSAQDYRVELGANQTIPEFEQNLLGMAKQETKTFDAVFPKDYHAPEMAGQTIAFTVTAKDIQEKKLAELNDEFAKDMGKFETLQALKDRIKEDLKSEKERQNKILLSDQISKELSKSTAVKIPEVLIGRSLDRMLMDYEMRLQRQSKTLEESGTTADAFREQNRGQVESELKAQLALREIGLLENIEVSEGEVDREVEKMAMAARRPLQDYKAYLDKNDAWDDIRSRIRDSKVIDLIIEHAKISYQ